MAYNRRNNLLLKQKVIEIYLREKKPGISTAYVFRTYILPIYPMTITTLYNYISTPIAKDLKELDEKNEVKQLKIF
ncbi:MAG: hypothetical protein ACOYMF_16005 [Bacteroidales bacterium]